MSPYKHVIRTMALLVVYWLHTRGFSFDRARGRRPLQPVNHAPTWYNLYVNSYIVSQVVRDHSILHSCGLRCSLADVKTVGGAWSFQLCAVVNLSSDQLELLLHQTYLLALILLCYLLGILSLRCFSSEREVKRSTAIANTVTFRSLPAK